MISFVIKKVKKLIDNITPYRQESEGCKGERKASKKTLIFYDKKR